MKVIGITGGIGSGKSTVCEVFSSLGVPVYDADIEAKSLMHTDTVKQKILQAFGSQAYKDGDLNRAFLADKVFTKGENIQTLNAIVHPEVTKHFGEWVDKQSSDYVIKEAALLIESDSYRSLHALINVSAPIDLRIARIQKRDPFRSLEEIQGIIDKQVSEEERMNIADFTIENDEKKMLIPQIMELHEKFSQ